ncbi:MAG: PIG-L family deacetylase [Endomicrobiales bacterium]|nr:PIG-L family deacetylase [Endomicrobiales bacterium]
MKILAIGAHPDDLEYGCGGTLYKLAKARHDISLLIMTRGDLGGKPDRRQKEQENAARLLKAKLFWGRFSDTQIPLQKETINTIEFFIKKIKPDLIFTIHPKDTHQDHRNVSQATITAARYVQNVLFYEVPSTFDFTPASVFVDIGKVLDKKVSLLKAHKSQVFATRIANLSILEAAKSTALFRGVQNRVKYAEGFVPLRLSLDKIDEF